MVVGILRYDGSALSAGRAREPSAFAATSEEAASNAEERSPSSGLVGSLSVRGGASSKISDARCP